MRNEASRNVKSDEIDLVELWRILWGRKLIILSTVVMVVAAAALYVLNSAPIFEAKSFILPPTKSDIAQLNYGRNQASGLGVFTPKDVYAVYLRALQSESLRRNFFRTVYLPNLPESERQGPRDVLYAEFNKALTIESIRDDGADRSLIKSLSGDPSVSVMWVTRYSEMASDRAKKILIDDADAEVGVLIKNLEQHIRSAREEARKQRDDQIARLEEALKISKAVSLTKPPIISNGLNAEVSSGMQGSLTYMRGSLALEAEIENLRSRQSDDPFVGDLRETQEKLDFYRNLHLNPAVVEVFQQDGVIEVPDAPIRLRKALIILVGGFVGLVLGIMLASIVHLVGVERARRASIS